mmetsp:Transcript_48490/g.62230  ORF Transcript_48490/g.62230 Transcript_48490/m.62230 type:complete len:86 (-) Transcript_48490:27-284(-)
MLLLVFEVPTSLVREVFPKAVTAIGSRWLSAPLASSSGGDWPEDKGDIEEAGDDIEAATQASCTAALDLTRCTMPLCGLTAKSLC